MFVYKRLKKVATKKSKKKNIVSISFILISKIFKNKF